jgi:hypothetical protein
MIFDILTPSQPILPLSPKNRFSSEQYQIPKHLNSKKSTSSKVLYFKIGQNIECHE